MRWIHLMFLFLSMLIIFADKQVIGFAAGPLMEEFNLNPSQWGVVGSSFFIVYIFTGFIGGTWSDRLGPIKVIFFILAGLSIVQFSSIAIIGLPKTK